jgi:predicted nucleic acid-binding protein
VDHPLYSPTLLVNELTNVFYRHLRAGYLSRTSVDLGLDAVSEPPLRLESHASLVKPAVCIASSLRLPATYDAYYLALAERYDADL